MAHQKKGPWHVVSSKTMYQNPWITVREDKVIRPDGKDGIFGVVTMLPGVCVLPIDTAGNVYLAKEYKYGAEKETIEVISGGYEEGEDRLAAARRELKEETGLEASEIIELGFIDPFTTIVSCPNYLYVARGLKEGVAEPEGTEVIDIIKAPYQQARDWVMDGTITHGGSVAVILMAGKYVK